MQETPTSSGFFYLRVYELFDRLPALALSVAAVLIFSLMLPNSYDVQRVGMLIILGVLSLLSLSRIAELTNDVALPVLAVVILLVTTVRLSEYQWVSLAVASFLFASIICITMLGFRITDEQSQSSITIITVMSGVLLLISLGLQAISFLETGMIDRSLAPGFNNQRHFNQVQALITPLLVGASLLVPFKFRHRVAIGTLGFVSLCLMFVSHGRGVVLSYLLSLFFMAIWSEANRKRLFVYGLLLVSGAFLATLGLDLWLEGALIDRYTASNSSGRLDLWIESIRLAAENFPFGVGGGLFPLLNESGYRVAHPHNTLFWILSEFGVLVLFVIALLIWRVFARLLKALDETNPFHVIVLFSLISGCVYSLLGGLALMPMSSLLLILMFVWANGLATQSSAVLTPYQRSPNWSISILRISVAVAAIVIIAVAALRFTLLDDLLSYRGNGPIWPGFWLNGRFWDNLP